MNVQPQMVGIEDSRFSADDWWRNESGVLA
jgi:hypothetical protein